MNNASGIYLIFDIYDSYFTIPHDYVLGVQRGSPIVPLPFAPPYISGAPEGCSRPLQRIVILDSKQNIGFCTGQRLSVKSLDSSWRITTNFYTGKFVKNVYTLGDQQDSFAMELDISQILSCVMQ